ncbi:MAG: nucleotidyltransferase, partial [Candidatus Contubernalis sp.]|nr:nucleotidyltransferase [Candidatus Contubernalis sp.]
SKNLFGSNGIRGEANLEITPELAAAIGNIYGVLLKEGAVVTLSSDDWKASRLLKHAVASGLMASGAEVIELGDLITPMARLSVKDKKAKGGVHIHRSPREKEEVCIQLFDDLGLNIPKGLEKKIEQAYHSQDYKRMPGNDTGEMETQEGIEVAYRQNVLENIDQEVIIRNSLRILLVKPEPLMYSIISPILGELAVETFVYQPFENEGEFDSLSLLNGEREIILEKMNKANADMAVFMDVTGETLSLMDDQGRLIFGDYFTALISYMLFKGRGGGVVAVPVTVSQVIEKMAQDFNGKVLRTKTSPRHFMEQLHEQDLHLQFKLQYNAPASLVKILEFMSQEGVSFSQLISQVPESHLSHKKTGCPWEAKGKVMRKLIEENRGKDVELIDGVKVHHPEGWVLVLPDPEEPLYQVFGEGSSEEKSEILTDTYVGKIQEIQREST